jgi:predicted CoA-binding protein
VIITKQKTKEQILEALSGYKNIFVVGCGDCATTTKTGGAHEVKEMSEFLKKHHFHVTGTVVPETTCIEVQVRRAFREHAKAIEQADALLVLACGSGAQTVLATLAVKKPTFVACDTLCIGMMDKTGKHFFELCSACGECVLNETQGICPVTRCPKNMLNGPCGGVRNGKCEVDNSRDCVWVTIYERLSREHKLSSLAAIKTPKRWSTANKPRAHAL